MDEWMVRDRQMGEWMVGWMDEWIDRDGWMDGKIGR
jgi:hypothetical protein